MFQQISIINEIFLVAWHKTGAYTPFVSRDTSEDRATPSFDFALTLQLQLPPETATILQRVVTKNLNQVYKFFW